MDYNANNDTAPDAPAGARRLRWCYAFDAISRAVSRAGGAPTLVVFTELMTGFATSDLRDAQDQIVQLNSANELVWAADGTRLPGYRTNSFISGGHRHQFIEGKICAAGCAFEVRFGTADGDRRAYLTVDYGHDNPGTVVDVEVAGSELLVTQTDVYPPGSPTLSGVVMGMTRVDACHWKASPCGAAFHQAGAGPTPIATASTKYAD